MRRRILATTDWDDEVARRVRRSDHRVLALWACDCAERVLPLFERAHPRDPRPREAIATGRAWARTGAFRMAEVRARSLAAHVAAREAIENGPSRAAARSAGHAIATAHVPTHSIAAALYAVTAIRDGTGDPRRVAAERRWQLKRLDELSARTARRTPGGRLPRARPRRGAESPTVPHKVT